MEYEKSGLAQAVQAQTAAYGYGQMQSPTAPGNLNELVNGSIARAGRIKMAMTNHHACLFGAQPENLAKGPEAPPSNLLSSLQLLASILSQIEDAQERVSQLL